jgi:divalent metal cation (Fe/Co/Zn/Cd) transporter
VIGIILACVALFLGYETRALLVGETISEELGAAIRQICLADEAVEDLVRMIGVHLGPDEVLLNLGLQFDQDLGAEAVAQAVEQIERKIRAEDPRVTRVFIEPEISKDPGGLSTPF